MMTLQAAVRVMIADDNPDMLLLVRTTLGSDDRVEVVGEAADGLTAIEAFLQWKPDACVLDYQMPGMSGLDAARRILEEDPETSILIFSAFLTPEIAEAAAELGVRCLRKDLFMDLAAEVVDLVRGG